MNRRQLNAMLARIQAASVEADGYGTMEDTRNQVHLATVQARQAELLEQSRDAIARRDYKTALNIGIELRKLGASLPARPPAAQRPRCGAKTRAGHPCKMAALWLKGEPAPRNGRCRLHGGLSTGPKTPEGRAAIAESNRRRAAVNKRAVRSQ